MSILLKDSERKFTLSMKPIDGVHLSDCKLEVYFFVGNRKVRVEDSCLINVDNDTYKVLLLTSQAKILNDINIKMEVNIGIPDSDFPDGYRNQKYELWAVED